MVKVEKTAGGYRLLRDGQPYFIKGEGGHLYLETLKAAGANSIRTWGEDNIELLLDRAHQIGLTVTIGIWLGQERQGFNYGDPLIARWEVRSEISERKTGGDPEAPPPAHPEAFLESHGLRGSFRAPELSGAYRLFVYVYDGKGHAATANVPFFVKATSRQ